METLISVVIGVVASFLQGKKGKNLGKKTRYTIALLSSVIVAFLASFIENMDSGGFTVDQILMNTGTAFISAQTIYQTYLKKNL